MEFFFNSKNKIWKMLPFFLLFRVPANLQNKKAAAVENIRVKGKTKTIVLDTQKINCCLTLFNHHYHIYYNFAESLKFQ